VTDDRASASDLSGFELYALWKSSGLSQRDLAARLEMDFDAMHGLIFRAQKVLGEVLNDDGKEKIEFEQDGNTATARGYSTRRITTLDDLIEVCKIDLDVWEIPKARVNKWEVGAKVAKKSLVWENGEIVEGFIDDPGKLTIEPLFQVEAHLVKRNPVPLEPVVSPVRISPKSLKRIPPVWATNNNTLILADPHFGFARDEMTGELIPFHDRRALSIAIQVAQDIQPETIVIVGDLADLAEFSDKFARGPELYRTTQPAIKEGTWFLAQLRLACPHARIIWIEGNHDNRWEKYLIQHAEQVYRLRRGLGFDARPITSLPYLFNVDELDIEYIGDYPNGEAWITDHAKAIHGFKVKANPGATATTVIEDAAETVVFGHVHRIELATRTIWGRHGARIISAFCPGCLCHIDGRVPAVRAHMDWQNGIGVLQHHGDEVLPIPVHIRDGVAYYNGKKYTAEDYVVQLRHDTGYKLF